MLDLSSREDDYSWVFVFSGWMVGKDNDGEDIEEVTGF
jgi:hypothetical protein